MLRRNRDLTQKVVFIALLFLVPTLVSAPALRRGDLPMEMNSLTTLPPWQEARPAGHDSSEAAGVNPVTDRYYPWYVFLSQAGASRELPLWNPYEGLGIPFLALWRTRALSPFSLPLYVFQLHAAIGMAVFLKLLVAGFCAYYVARRFQYAPPHAFLAAVTFQMSGLLLVGHWHPASDVIPWFPLLLPCIQRMLLGNYRVWPYLALLFGVMTLGGDPETLVGIMLFVFVLAFIYSLRTYTYRHLPGALATLVVGMLLGLALAAVQLAPFIEFIQHGELEEAPKTFFQIRDFAALLAPAPRPNTIDANLWLPAGLVGFLLFPLWLAVRPFTNRIRRRRLEALLFAALFLLTFAVAFSAMLRRIPGFSLLDVFHFSAPLPLALGMLAATAADEWIHLDADKCREALRKLAWYLPCMWGGVFGLAFMAVRAASPDTGALTGLSLSSLAALALLLLIIITAFRPKESVIVCALILITAGCSWWTYAPRGLITPNALVFPETSFIRTLQNQKSRVAGSARLKDWPLSSHQIPQIYSPAGVALARTQQYIRHADEKPEFLRLSGAQALLLTKQDLKGRFSTLRPILNIQDVFPSGAILMRDLQAHDRARVVHTGRAYDAENPQTLRMSGPPLLEGGVLPPSLNDNAATSNADISHNTLNTVKIAISSNRPGVLVLADAWYPGWRLTIDTSPGNIFPVDIAFRGVEISEGTREVVFNFAPFSLKIGAYISLATLLVIVVGMVTLLRARLRA